MTGHIEHEYLSTGCLHGDMMLPDGRTGHEYCQGDTGHAGSKRPAECKFCGTRCICGCHPWNRVLSLDTFGTQIQDARRQLGWSQQDLADVVGVGQQAVSGWERGRTTAQGADLERVRQALGFTSVAAPTSPEETHEAATLPPPRRLPLMQLEQSDFVNFAASLLRACHPGAIIDHEPRQQRQRTSVDVRLVLPGGERVAVKCERLRKFHPTSFERVMRETAHVDADICLLLVATSMSETVKARAAGTPWSIWDGDKINEQVRALDPDVAAPLVQHYFPDLGASFIPVAPEH
jgi:transcriptional regulator with XRE-family HTH domain